MSAQRLPAVLLALAIGSSAVERGYQTGQIPVFRTGVDLVQVYATVRDAAGQPVRGLRAEDFSVLDNDRQVPLQVVSEVAGAVFEGPEWSRQHTVNVASNEPVSAKRLVVIVLDDARMGSYGRDRTRVRELGRQLVQNLAPDDLACVVFTATNSGAQDFTADRALLLQAVDSLGGGFGDRNYSPIMAVYSVDVLRRVAATLAGTPARRKILVFVGAGQMVHILPPNTSKPVANPPPGSRIDADTFGVAGRVDALLKAAQKSGMAVYVIDPRSQVPNQRSPMTLFVKDLARHTGAIAVVGEPDAREAARRVMTDAAHYYVLGFRADETARPGLYRRIRVSVSRAGVEVRSQTGYYPPKTVNENEPLPELKGAPTTAALAGALPTGGLPLQLSLTSFARQTSGAGLAGQIAVSVEVGAPGSATSHPSGSVRLELRIFDGEGRREIAVITDRRHILGSGQVNPLPVIQVPPGRYNVRVALHHDESQLTGSVYGTVTVPDYSKALFSASDVFVQVPGSEPEGWRAGVSSVRRSFLRTEAVSLLTVLYVARQPVIAVAQIEILNASSAVVHRESRNMQVGPSKRPFGTETYFELPLARLASGPYLAKISISAGKAQLHRNIVFAVR